MRGWGGRGPVTEQRARAGLSREQGWGWGCGKSEGRTQAEGLAWDLGPRVAQSHVHHVTEMFWTRLQTLGAKKQRVVG